MHIDPILVSGLDLVCSCLSLWVVFARVPNRCVIKYYLTTLLLKLLLMLLLKQLMLLLKQLKLLLMLLMLLMLQLMQLLLKLLKLLLLTMPTVATTTCSEQQSNGRTRHN